MALTQHLLKARYRKTWVGVLWVLLNPMIRFFSQLLIFQYVLIMPVEKYPFFLLTGLLPWHFFNQSLEMSMSVIVDYARWVRTVAVHPTVYIFAQVLDCFISFASAFILLLIFFALIDPIPLISLFFLALALIPLTIFTLSSCWFLAVLQVFYRDTRFVVSLILQIGFLMTPIFYSEKSLPNDLKWLVAINPLYYVLQPFRIAIFAPHTEDFFPAFLMASAMATFLFVIALQFGEKCRAQLIRAL